MSLPIVFNNTVYPAGFYGTDDGPPKSPFRIDDVYTYSVSVTGTVNAVGDPVTITLNDGSNPPTTLKVYATQFDNAGMIQFSDLNTGGSVSNNRYVLSNTQMFGTGSPNRTTFTADGNGTVGDYNVAAAPCFVSGTHIRVLRGGVESEAKVEDLLVGDRVVTASGALRSIEWIGHRTIDCRAQRVPHDVMPVRVAAHAFGPGLPARDLYLSPGHPVLIGADEDGEGGHLVPIMCLINGTTIERVALDEVTYWHVELDGHDILLAEGLPAESYLDWGDRPFFGEAEAHALMNPDFVVPGLDGRCRPVAIDGPVVEAERRRLDAVFATRLAAASAWPTHFDALAW